jgi:hypothetical protein
MAMTTCKECGKEVSDQARTCPACGVRVKRGPWLAVLTVIAGLFAAFMAYGFYLTSLPGAAEASQARDAYKVCADLARQQGDSTIACDAIIDNFRAKYGRQP